MKQKLAYEYYYSKQLRDFIKKVDKLKNVYEDDFVYEDNSIEEIHDNISIDLKINLNKDKISSFIDELNEIEKDIYEDNSNGMSFVTNFTTVLVSIMTASLISTDDKILNILGIIIFVTFLFVFVLKMINKNLAKANIDKYHFVKGYLYYEQNKLLN